MNTTKDAPAPRRALLRVLAPWSAALILALVVLAPALLSTRALRPVVERMVRHRLGAGAAVAHAAISWRGPITLHGVRAGGAAGADATRMTCAEAEVDLGLWQWLRNPGNARWTLRGLHLDVPRDREDATLAGWIRGLGDGGRVRMVLEEAALRVLAPDGQVHAAIESLDLELDHLPGSTRAHAAAQLTGAAGSEALELALQREPGRLHLELRCAANLDALAPIVRAALPGAVLGGRLDADLRATHDPSGTAAFRGRAHGRALALRLPAWFGGALVQESNAALEGGMEIDWTGRRARFDDFHLGTSFLGVDGDGTLQLQEEGLAGDLRWHGEIDFERTARRCPPLLALLRPWRFAGNVRADLAATGPGAVRVDLAGDFAGAGLPDGRFVPLGECAAGARVTLRPDPWRLRLEEAFATNLSGVVEGTCDLDLGGPGPFGLDLDATLRADALRLQDQLHGLLHHPRIDHAGEVEVTVQVRLDDAQGAIEAAMDSADYEVRLERDAPGNTESYALRGRPWTLAARASWPRGHDPLRAGEAAVELTAPEAWLQLDPLTDLRVRAELRDGVARTTELRARGYEDGSLSGAWSADFNARPCRMEFTAEGRDLQVSGRLPLHLLARAAVVGAAAPVPFQVRGTSRMTVAGRVEGEGPGITELARSMRGQIDLTLGPGTFQGSTLLDALDDGSSPSDLDGLTAQVALTPGVLRSEVELRLPGGRRCRLRGTCTAGGTLDFTIPPADVLDGALLDRLGSAPPDDLFHVGGTVYAPSVRLPDETFRRLLREGRRDEALRRLQAGS